jgi:hypothetical protein
VVELGGEDSDFAVVAGDLTGQKVGEIQTLKLQRVL